MPRAGRRHPWLCLCCDPVERAEARVVVGVGAGQVEDERGAVEDDERRLELVIW